MSNPLTSCGQKFLLTLACAGITLYFSLNFNILHIESDGNMLYYALAHMAENICLKENSRV